MDYEIKFTGSLDDNQRLIQMINASNAFDALWEIRRLCKEAESVEDSDIAFMEIHSVIQEILDHTYVEGMF